MIQKILSLSKQLISIRSHTGNKGAMDDVLKVVKSNLSGFTIEQFENKGIKSILVYRARRRPSKFKVILNGHLDIIPGKDYQYNPIIIGNRLYGVGALDMKTSVVCLMTVFKDIANKVKYPLALQLVTDEEIGGFNGTKFQIEREVRADFVVAGEATNLNIVNEAKGILWLKISSKGKTAHGAYPWRGENAIQKMSQFLARLEKKYPIPKKENWVTTVNLSRIETDNQTFNKIPDKCSINLDIRFIPKDSNRIVNNIKKLLSEGFTIKIIENEPSFSIDNTNPFIQSLKKITQEIVKKKIMLYGAQGSSDVRHFTKVGSDGIEFGPAGGGIGSNNEWVNIPSLYKYITVLKRFLLSL